MERLEEILKEYKEYNKGGLTHAKNEILDLFSVMLSEALEEAEVIAVLRDNGKSDHSLGESQGFESGAEWVIDTIKDKLHSA